ncbi:protein sprint isoform X2 [Phlebotomus papatasi]|uniref:protein sprint isoform X2 n=1 Tax=Phlebotomus papatasi TaxID=29031 RepID=UPI0024842C28|nr:protein sprint isoform X2 [Phlebotomus papatasi]
MFPPADSPVSSTDHEILDGPQISTPDQIPKLPEGVAPLFKSSNTLRNNIDAKDEVARKRTSLKIENSTSLIMEEHLVHKKRLSLADSDLAMCTKRTVEPEKCSQENSQDVPVKKTQPDSNRNSLQSSNPDDDDYNDLENGNSSSGADFRDSIVSSEAELLCEKLNTINKATDSDGNHTELLSPNEGPLARRYAEIAHFRSGKWSDAIQPSRSNKRFTLGSLDPDECAVGSGNGGCYGDDDLQALIPPAARRLSRDELSQSRTSLVSSSDGGILAEGETSSESSGGSTSPPCDLGLVERLLRTHPVWFLPGIQRAGAVHLLQGKEEGNFVVRGSSQANTMAVSVRLPPDTGPYIEHYLIQSDNGILSLESSRFKFDSIPALIAHYAQCCDELPVQLMLPRALREAKNRQQLSSLALLGQEFWRYPMASPKPGSQASTPVDPKSAATDSSGVGVTVFSSSVSQKHPPKPLKGPNILSPGQAGSPHCQVETPSDTSSSLSSFTPSNGHQLLSPESIDSVVLTMSPVESCRSGIVGKTSTFKTQLKRQAPVPLARTPELIDQGDKVGVFGGESFLGGQIRAPRPTPPNTLNLGPLRTPPAPPPRWSKPVANVSPDQATVETQANNFTVTTTVTFSMESGSKAQSPQIVEVSSPTASDVLQFQTISKRLSPEGECHKNGEALSTLDSKRWISNLSRDTSRGNRKVQSPSLAETPNGQRMRRSKAKKESKHYQESDILESPSVYCRSALGDKISDYEDIWTQENNNGNLLRGSHMSSFRPEVHGKRPDLLAETPTVTSLNGNLLSPTGSLASSNNSPPKPPSETDSVTPLCPQAESTERTSFLENESLVAHLANPKEGTQRFGIYHKNQTSGSDSDPMLQPRNRLGLVLTSTPPKLEDPTTPVGASGRSKQGSPFYSEPVDSVQNITRRSNRNSQIPNSQRFSEPPKGPFRSALASIIPHGDAMQRNPLAGSLDELKKRNRKARGRLDPWPLDSSWEFVGNDANEENDYDSDLNWRTSYRRESVQAPPQVQPPKPQPEPPRETKQRPLTIHQIIATRMPELNLPEQIRCSTPTPESSVINGTITRRQRISAYDNVERGATSSLLCPDSAQSDDGTVFSEPWDSSQWDSFLPQDDASDSIHLSKCRALLGQEEDDTLVEDASQREKQPAKVATIFRSRSCRDREILCHPRNKTTSGGPGESVGAYAMSLANDPTSTFARNIENFICCTKESREAAPQIVMRNMRQFMSGMKNYLVKHGEGDFQLEVQRACSRLKPDEFLNLDTILEGVMQRLVVLPLREHLYGLFVEYYTRSRDIQLLVENVRFASGKSAIDMGIRKEISPPSESSMRYIAMILQRLQEAEQPLEKLDYLLAAVSAIFEATGSPKNNALCADDFLPILVYVVAKSGFVGAEIEAEFMWGLLQPSLLSGEAGYYLTALCSAAHVLKTFKDSQNEMSGTIDWRSSAMPACSSVLRVIIPDEYNGSLQTRTLPVRPHTTTKEVCRIIAHKARITNPQDYGLFKLVDGEETLLMDSECPQDARLAARGKHWMLAYKRIDAKIAWPTTAASTSGS